MQFSLSVLDSVARRLYEERLQIEEKRAEEREKRKEDRENSENGNSLSKSSSSDECRLEIWIFKNDFCIFMTKVSLNYVYFIKPNLLWLFSLQIL